MAPTPRGRPRKTGNTRMHAALDAMGPLGFSAKLVRQTVDELLKVYGGNDGWVFIEEAAYTLLINTILEKQNSASEAQDNTRDDSRTEALPAGSSSAVLVPCSDTEALDAASRTNEAVDPASATNESDCQLVGNVASSEDHGTTLTYSSPRTKSPQPVESFCYRRRRPFHGWICNDDEEELIELPPAPLPKELAMLIDGAN